MNGITNLLSSLLTFLLVLMPIIVIGILRTRSRSKQAEKTAETGVQESQEQRPGQAGNNAGSRESGGESGNGFDRYRRNWNSGTGKPYGSGRGSKADRRYRETFRDDSTTEERADDEPSPFLQRILEAQGIGEMPPITAAASPAAAIRQRTTGAPAGTRGTFPSSSAAARFGTAPSGSGSRTGTPVIRPAGRSSLYSTPDAPAGRSRQEKSGQTRTPAYRHPLEAAAERYPLKKRAIILAEIIGPPKSSAREP